MTSLREWARNKEIWKPESWIEFIDSLNIILQISEKILKIYDFLKQFDGKELREIEKPYREKIETAVAGGIDSENPFSKFMFERFGIHVGNTYRWEDSFLIYKNLGERAIIKVDKSNWISNIENFKNLIENLMRHFEEKGITSGGKINLENFNPLDYLPNKGEKPEKLINLINSFIKEISSLALGVNPYTTFATFARFNYAQNIKEFLGIKDEETFKNLMSLLELELRDVFYLKKLENYTDTEPILIYAGPRSLVARIYSIFVYLDYIYNFNPSLKNLVKNWIKENLFSRKIYIPKVRKKESDFTYHLIEISFVIENGFVVGTYHTYNSYNIAIDDFVKKVKIIDALNSLIPFSEFGIVEVNDIYSYYKYGKEYIIVDLKINKHFVDILNEYFEKF